MRLSDDADYQVMYLTELENNIAKGCQGPEVESIVIWFGFVVVLGLVGWFTCSSGLAKMSDSVMTSVHDF